ncbi:MAG: MIP/aquaporin family protein [Actinomycetes bacterium]
MTTSNTAMFISEFLGTMLLLLLGIGVGCNQTFKKSFGYGKDWLMTSIGWGFGVFVGASVSYQSGAQLNPAVTIGLALTGGESWSLVPLFITAQVLGAFTGAWLAYLAYKKQFDTHDDPANTGGLFYTSAAVRSNPWNLVTEAIGTFVLVYWVLDSSPFQPGTGDSAPIFGNAALGYAAVAFVVISIGASLGGPTGYAINPARDFGPRLAYTSLPIKGKGSSNWGYAWVAIVGPLIGAVVAAEAFNLVGS